MRTRPDGPLLIAAGGHFEGLVTYRGAARLAGSLRGDVLAEGRLEILPEGRVVGRIRVDEAVVAGEVEGSIEARGRVELRPGAWVRGDLLAPRIQLADGSRLDGRCRIPDAGSTRREALAGASRRDSQAPRRP